MAIVFSGGIHRVDHSDLDTADIEVAGGGALYLRGVECGDIVVTDGALYLDDVDCFELAMAGAASNRIHGVNVRPNSIDLTGGNNGQEVRLAGLTCSGALASAGTFDIWDVDGVFGDSIPGSVSKVDISGLTGFSLRARILGSAQHGLLLDACVAGDVHTKILDPSQETDNTYDGISLQGACDQLDIRGSVRGAINHVDNPRYGIDVGASCTAIELWLAISGAATGDINDQTSGEVTIH